MWGITNPKSIEQPSKIYQQPLKIYQNPSKINPTSIKTHPKCIKHPSKIHQNTSKIHPNPFKIHQTSIQNHQTAIQYLSKAIQNPSKAIQKWFWHLFGCHSNCGDKYVDLPTNTALSEPKAQKNHQASIQNPSNIHPQSIKQLFKTQNPTTIHHNLSKIHQTAIQNL